MPWYTVTKTINGRQYLYLQMTYREGGKVRTKNKYLGPASSAGASFGFGAPANLPTAEEKTTNRPSGGVRIDKIRRLKPKPRHIQNRAALENQLLREALENRRNMVRARRKGASTEPYKFDASVYRHSFKIAFGKRLNLAKKKPRK